MINLQLVVTPSLQQIRPNAPTLFQCAHHHPHSPPQVLHLFLHVLPIPHQIDLLGLGFSKLFDIWDDAQI